MLILSILGYDQKQILKVGGPPNLIVQKGALTFELV